MNADIEIVIILLVVLSILIFFIGMQIGRIIGQNEMGEIIRMHKHINSIYKGIATEMSEKHKMLSREYIKLAKE